MTPNIDFYIPPNADVLIDDAVFVYDAIDGDTVVLGRTYVECRLIGIDAPEHDEHYYREATDKLKLLTVGMPIVLESDVEDTDHYGRLLRYIYTGSLFVNVEMVRLGYAYAYVFEPNTKYADLIQNAENEAIHNGVGVWS